MRAAKRGGFSDRLDRAGLVVGQHEADQPRRSGREPVAQGGQIGDPRAVHRQFSGARRGGTDRVMLRGADHDPPVGAQCVDGERVGLGAAGREHDILAAGAESRGDGFAGGFQQASGGAAGGVDGCRVAGEFERGRHRRFRLGAKRFAGVGVEVMHCLSALLSRDAAEAAAGRHRAAATWPSHDIGEGHAAEEKRDLAAEFGPEIVGLTAVGELAGERETRAGFVVAAGGANRFVDRGDDGGDGDAVGIARKAIAAAGSSG